MTTTQHAYDSWSSTYDTVENRTHDLEARAVRAQVTGASYGRIIELGCGTGKNTAWLAARTEHLTAVDFSEAMLAQAQAKNPGRNVEFWLADISQPWEFANPESADLITCSLILEHVADLDFVFRQAARALTPGGHFYVGELHPFKQYLGSKARFTAPDGTTQTLTCYVHHLTDYAQAAQRAGLRVEELREWFDDDERQEPPRIVGWMFRKGG